MAQINVHVRISVHSFNNALSLHDKQLEVLISDNGAGISEDNFKKIFDPFFTTKDPGKGTGLGLSIVFKVISNHKGSIEYHSELGKGTIVKILFPVE